jgi:hypothetical protein
MGNIVIVKIPTVGGLAHFLTMEAFAKALPAGTIHFVSGSGRETMPPLMKTGHIDGLAFIGGASAANALIKEPPNPHRLKIFLQLEGKNMAIFLSDIFHEKNEETLNRALDGTVMDKDAQHFKSSLYQNIIRSNFWPNLLLKSRPFELDCHGKRLKMIEHILKSPRYQPSNALLT